MDLAHHDITVAFAEYKDRLHALRHSDSQFADLVASYYAVDDEIVKAEQGVQPHDDQYMDELKMRRVHFKDQVYARLRGQAAP